MDDNILTFIARLFLIPQRLARLQHRRDSLLRFSLTAQREKSFAFQIEQILFADKSLMIEFAAAEDFGDFLGDERVVVGDKSAALHHRYGDFERRDSGFAHCQNVRALDGLNVASRREI